MCLEMNLFPFFLMHVNLTTVNHEGEISLSFFKNCWNSTKIPDSVCAIPGKSSYIHHLSAEQKQRDVNGGGGSMLNSSLTESSQWDFPWLREYDFAIHIAVHCSMTELAKGSKSQNANSQMPPVSSRKSKILLHHFLMFSD